MKAWREAPEWHIGEAPDAGGVERLRNRCPRHRPAPGAAATSTWFVCGLAALLVEYAGPGSAHEAPPGSCPAGRLPVENGVVAVRTHGGCVRMIGSIFEIVHRLVLDPAVPGPYHRVEAWFSGAHHGAGAPLPPVAVRMHALSAAKPTNRLADQVSGSENLNSTSGSRLASQAPGRRGSRSMAAPPEAHAPGQLSTNGNRFRGAPVPADGCKRFLWRGFGLHAPTLHGSRTRRHPVLPGIATGLDPPDRRSLNLAGLPPRRFRNGASESSHITYGYVTDPISRETQEGP